MFALLSDGEQALIRGKVTVGSEINGEFICDYKCGYSSNSFNTVASHELYCLKNVDRSIKPLEVQLAYRKIYKSIFQQNMPKMSAQNRNKIFKDVQRSGTRCPYQKKICNLMGQRIKRLDQMRKYSKAKKKDKTYEKAPPNGPSAPSTPNVLVVEGNQSEDIDGVTPQTTQRVERGLLSNYYLELNKKRKRATAVAFNKRKTLFGRRKKIKYQSNLRGRSLYMFKWFKMHNDYKRQLSIVESVLDQINAEMFEILDLIFKHVPGWSPLWEKLSHTPGDGHCGTLDLESLKIVLSTLKYILRLSGYPESLFTIIELGCGVLDFAKALHIGLSKANLFCFDLKNYIDNVFSDLSQVSMALRNLRHLISTKKGINIGDLGDFEYAFGTAIRSPQCLKDFLKSAGASSKVIKSKFKICTLILYY